MPRSRAVRSLVPLIVVAMLGWAACGEDEDPMGGGGGGGNIADPDVFETEVSARFGPAAAGVIDALQRLLDASNGEPPDGVVISPTSTGADVTVQLDLDGDGTRESTVSGSVDGEIETGALFTVSGISVPSLPDLSGGMSARGTQTTSTTLVFDQMSGSASADPPGPDNAASASISNGVITLDLLTQNLSGFIDIVVTSHGESLIIEITFESDGAGGWRARFEGEGVDFTVP